MPQDHHRFRCPDCDRTWIGPEDELCPFCEIKRLRATVAELRGQRDLLALNADKLPNSIYVVLGPDGSVIDVVLKEQSGSDDPVQTPASYRVVKAAAAVQKE